MHQFANQILHNYDDALAVYNFLSWQLRVCSIAESEIDMLDRRFLQVELENARHICQNYRSALEAHAGFFADYRTLPNGG
jgi:hypothetical protein